MNRCLSILLLIFTIGCKKETSVEDLASNQKQFITAEYLDGQKLKDFFYDNDGKLIGARNYLHPKSTEDEWVMERIYNDKGLAIRDNYRSLNQSLIRSYEIYEYNSSGEIIADSIYSYTGSKYTLWDAWILSKTEYDMKGRLIKMDIEYIDRSTSIRYYEFVYDNNSNIREEFNSISTNIWLPFTNQYEFSAEPVFEHPLSNNNLYTYNRWNHRTDRNFCTKFSNPTIIIKFSILEKNTQENPTKIRWDIKRSDGETQTDIYTYTYK